MPTTLEKLENQNIVVEADDERNIVKLEKRGTWLLYVVLISSCWLFLSIFFPIGESSWEIPLTIFLVILVTWVYTSHLLGKIIIRYEDESESNSQHK